MNGLTYFVQLYLAIGAIAVGYYVVGGMTYRVSFKQLSSSANQAPPKFGQLF